MVHFGVVEGVVTVDGPLSCNVLVELLREDAFLRELVGDIAGSWDLVGRVL